jgi:hypothetical protein
MLYLYHQMQEAFPIIMCRNPVHTHFLTAGNRLKEAECP